MRLNSKLILSALGILVLVVPVTVYAINTVDTGYKLLPNTFQDITVPGVTCKRVTNHSGDPDPASVYAIFDIKTFFIPTKILNDPPSLFSVGWNSFLNNLPEEISVCDCGAIGCGGVPTSSSGSDIYYHYYRGEEPSNFWE